jgi:mono/diheme cytochrome c family protein
MMKISKMGTLTSVASTVRCVGPLLVLTLFGAFAAAQSKDLTGNADNGKKIFVKNGCYQCHGYVGQGGVAGARLAQTKLPLAGFTAYVRNPPPGGMPPFRAKIMSDQELADVWAYIKSIPEPKPVKDIPLLNE